MKASGTMLGITLSDTAVQIAEVQARGGKPAVRKLATLMVAPEFSLAHPALLGEKLAELLKQKEIDANDVVVGVPARWTISSEKDVPPAALEQVHGVLRLQAERMSSSDSGEMTVDYAGTLQSNKSGKTLLVAIRKSQVAAISAAMEAAKLDLVAIMPSSLALATMMQQSTAPMVMLDRSGAELVVGGSAPRMLRHISLPGNGEGSVALAPLGLDLRRSLALVPVNGSAASNGSLTLFDSLGISEPQRAELAQRSGLRVAGEDNLGRLGVSSDTMPPGGMSLSSFAPAVALALTGLQPKLLPLNFADSKLAPPPERRFGRKTYWGAGIAGAIILLIIGLFIDNQILASQLAGLNAERTRIDPDVVAAQSVSDRVDFSNGFFNSRTPMLDCLRQVTDCFRDEETIWVDSLNVNEDTNPKSKPGIVLGRIDGKTTSQRFASELNDRMGQHPGFTTVKLITLAGASGKQKDQSSFSIGFDFHEVSKARQ